MLTRPLFTGMLFTILTGLCAQTPAEKEVLVTTQDAFLDGGTVEGEIPKRDGAEAFTAGFDPEAIHSEDGLVIWPVPAADILHIYCSGSSTGKLPFEVVSLSGRVVLRGTIQGGSANIIELTEMAPGDHLLRVVDGRSVRHATFRKVQ